MSKKSDLGVRARTAIIFGIAMIGGMYWNVYSYLALMTAIMLASVFEYQGIIAKATKPNAVSGWYRPYSMLVALVLFGLSTLHVLGYNVLGYAIIIPVMLFGFFILELFAHSEKPFENVGYQMLGAVYLISPFMLLNYIAVTPRLYYWQLVMSIFFIIWANDVFAYLVGRQIGKTKLLERISPGKTWEGSAGGAVGAMGFAIALHYLFHLEGLLWYDWVVMAALISIFSTLGDLSESMLKRSLGLKDSGNLLPGHGGMLDRFDAFYFAVPAVAAYLFLRGWMG